MSEAPKPLSTWIADIEPMPDFLEASFAALSAPETRERGPNGDFSPVEHAWHLADLELEGYAVRIRRLRDEIDPLLPDFDGARLASERDYRSRSLADGLAAFRSARQANVRSLRALEADHWLRRGRQEGVGELTLADLPRMMAEHDAGHRLEIDAWRQARRRTPSAG